MTADKPSGQHRETAPLIEKFGSSDISAGPITLDLHRGHDHPAQTPDLTLSEPDKTRDALAFARTFAFTPTLAPRQLDDA